MTDSSINYNFPINFPNELKLLILDRKDLLDQGFHKIENERLLVIWIISHGVREYEELLNIKDNGNNVIKWLSENSNDEKYRSLPKIVSILIFPLTQFFFQIRQINLRSDILTIKYRILFGI